MKHDKLVKAAQEAISALVSDTSVTRAQTYAELAELSELLQDDIEALEV